MFQKYFRSLSSPKKAGLHFLNSYHPLTILFNNIFFLNISAKYIFSLTTPFILQETTLTFWRKGGTYYLKINR